MPHLNAKEDGGGEEDDCLFALPTTETFTAELMRAIQGFQADINRSCNMLASETTGAKLLLIQKLSLKKASAYAGFYKNQILAQARQVQRQRSDLVKLLQRRAKQLLSSSSTYPASSPHDSTGAGDSKERAAMFANFDDVLSLVRSTTQREQTRTVVEFTLCPSLPAMRMFLQSAVLERGLHERVMASVLGGDRAREQHDGEHSQGDSPSGSSSVGDAALGEALELLFDCVNETERRGRGKKDEGDAGNPSPRVRVPTLLSLEQFFSDAAWSTTHDALSDDERRRRIAANPDGDEDPSDRIGFLFLRKSVRRLPQARQSASASAFAGRLRQANSTSDDRDEQAAIPPGLDEVVDDLHQHAHAIATEVVAAVDALWTATEREAEVESTVLALLREHAQAMATRDDARGGSDAVVVDVDAESGEGKGTSGRAEGIGGDGVRLVASEAEERQLAIIQEFLDAIRVFYSVELSARLLALMIAGKLLKESEDFLCFDGVRCVQLCVGEADAGSSPPSPTPENQPHLHPHAHSSSSGAGAAKMRPPAEALVPFTVFNLPDMESVFYCVALTLGLALLRDYQAFLGSPLSSTGKGGGGSVGDGEEEEEEEEEEALRLQRLGLHTVADRRRQQRAKEWLSSLEKWHMAAENPLSASGLPLPPMLRLWRYLWEHVFFPLPPTASGDVDSVHKRATENGEDVVEVLTTEGVPSPSPSSRDAARKDCIPLSRARARRWLEKQVAAAVARGVDAARLTSSSPSSPSTGTSSLPLLVAAGNRIRKEMMRLWPQQ